MILIYVFVYSIDEDCIFNEQSAWTLAWLCSIRSTQSWMPCLVGPISRSTGIGQVCAYFTLLLSWGIFFKKKTTTLYSNSEIVVKDQTNSDALFVRGMCLYYQDNVDKAFQHFQRVLQYSPDHAKAQSFYKKAKQLQTKKENGNQAFKAGKWQEAYDLYTDALTIDLNNKNINAILYYNRATTCAKVNFFNKSIFIHVKKYLFINFYRE